ncbi:MAG: cell division topological specificity factor MinE [Chloroflexi bacterium]|nr:cell division topological specificity factor MinE [Chloroflexota bacterium]
MGKKEKSGAVAKQRLQMVLIHDRSEVSPGLIEQIKDDIIQVIATRLAIDAAHVKVDLTQTGRESRLVAEIPLQANARSR